MADGVPTRAEDLLSSEPLAAFLATSVEDRPHVAPVWSRYEDGAVEVVTTGRKLANLRTNPRAALAVQKATAGIPEWTVTVLGTATVVGDESASRTAIRRVNEKYGVEPDAWEENVLVRIDAGSASYRTY
jgi:nitroimidazol reductase NimA-like FMN-containing flavoprotein (pyridoxamine 5'-phosphate oxidase superfamily)